MTDKKRIFSINAIILTLLLTSCEGIASTPTMTPSVTPTDEGLQQESEPAESIPSTVTLSTEINSMDLDSSLKESYLLIGNESVDSAFYIVNSYTGESKIITIAGYEDWSVIGLNFSESSCGFLVTVGRREGIDSTSFLMKRLRVDPDGNVIGEIYSTTRVIGSGSSLDISESYWYSSSADGSLIAFILGSGSFNELTGVRENGELFVTDVWFSQPSESLQISRNNGVHSYTWSSAVNRLYFVDLDDEGVAQIYSYDHTATETLQLTDYHNNDQGLDSEYHSLVLSGNEQYLAFRTPTNVGIIDLQTQKVNSISLAEDDTFIKSIDWYPDNEHLFVHVKGSSGDFDFIWLDAATLSVIHMVSRSDLPIEVSGSWAEVAGKNMIAISSSTCCMNFYVYDPVTNTLSRHMDTTSLPEILHFSMSPIYLPSHPACNVTDFP